LLSEKSMSTFILLHIFFSLLNFIRTSIYFLISFISIKLVISLIFIFILFISRKSQWEKKAIRKGMIIFRVNENMLIVIQIIK
jgi:hypothetical protein